ncbi:hypothetical protein OROHE_012288 [Orobanche hederae]
MQGMDQVMCKKCLNIIASEMSGGVTKLYHGHGNKVSKLSLLHSPHSPPPPLIHTPFTHAADPHSAMDFLQPLLGTRKGNSSQSLSKLKNFLLNLEYLESQSPYAATEALMGQPRCGNRDSFNSNSSVKYTFFPGNPKWPSGKKLLTYSSPPNTRNEAYTAVAAAANLWSDVSQFKFVYTNNYAAADIKISFQCRDHGDGSNFDGSGSVLAHAFAPTDGRLHFDGDEGGAFDIQTVGLHELGHMLGLGHSADDGSIMWPYIGNGFRKGLNNDDVA